MSLKHVHQSILVFLSGNFVFWDERTSVYHNAFKYFFVTNFLTNYVIMFCNFITNSLKSLYFFWFLWSQNITICHHFYVDFKETWQHRIRNAFQNCNSNTAKISVFGVHQFMQWAEFKIHDKGNNAIQQICSCMYTIWELVYSGSGL